MGQKLQVRVKMAWDVLVAYTYPGVLDSSNLHMGLKSKLLFQYSSIGKHWGHMKRKADED